MSPPGISDCIRMTLRVGISGSPGVGKTTLIKQLPKALPGRKVTVSTEVARTLAAKGVKINLECGQEDYFAFLTEHFRRTCSLKGEIILLDRTLLDVLCFMRLLGNVSNRLMNLTEELVKWQMHQLHWYFYIPPEFPTVADGLRIVDKDFVGAFDEVIRDQLKIHRGSKYSTLSGPLHTRLRIAARELERRCLKNA